MKSDKNENEYWGIKYTSGKNIGKWLRTLYNILFGGTYCVMVIVGRNMYDNEFKCSLHFI